MAFQSDGHAVDVLGCGSASTQRITDGGDVVVASGGWTASASNEVQVLD